MFRATIPLLLMVLLAVDIAASEARTFSCSVNDAKSIEILSSRTMSKPGGPEIRVSADEYLAVHLAAEKGVDIDLDSVRIRYGIFNITKKVAHQVGGIRRNMLVAGSILPAGRHKVSIEVRDSAGRATRIKLTLEVSQDDDLERCGDSLSVKDSELQLISENT